MTAFVISVSPEPGATDANPHFSVKAVFDMPMNASTINATSFTLEDALGPVIGTVYYDSGRNTAVFEPQSPLAIGVLHTATVKAGVSSLGGIPLGSDYTWSFTPAAVSLSPYHGSLHNHTAYSDGVKDPHAAFSAGQARGLDFMAVTDHSYQLNDSEWADTLAQAIAHTTGGTFVAMRGAEYSHASEGHVNVFDTVRHPVRSDTTATCTYCDYTPTLSDFYDWMAEHPEAMGQFNHPGRMNFNDWSYRLDAEPGMQLLEVGNDSYSDYVWTEEEYRKALDSGWRVGPTDNGDTSSDEWAIDNPGRSGIWATTLTYDGVLEALDAMRVFASEDGNLELYLKGNGAWMGETIPNDGSLAFEIYVNDPDGMGDDSLVSLALYTNHGQVVASTVPGTSPYTWSFTQDVPLGNHYYFASAEQADGDRIVSAPIWVVDTDVAPTRLEIVPAHLSTLAPAGLSARITNRGSTAATDVVVTFKADAAAIGTAIVTVPAGGEAFAATGWTPNLTGLVDISVQISAVPAGDHRDDNALTEQRTIVDYPVPLVIIDNGHSNNVFQSGDGDDFKGDLVDHGFNWVEDTDGISAADLTSATLLVISDPGDRGDDLFPEVEEQIIADYVNEGGALLLAGESDYSNEGNPDELNAILSKIDGASIRVNSDGAEDDTNNTGVGPGHVIWHVFPGVDETGIGVMVNQVVGFSGASIYGVDANGAPIPLVSDAGLAITVQGDEDTVQIDNDALGDLFVYPEGIPVPMAAVQELAGGGRIAVWGDSDGSFSNSIAYASGDGYQNEIYNMESIYWLLGRSLEKWTVAQARADAELDNTPDSLHKLVWIEGEITAGYGEFLNALYLQDETGGITVRAPAGGIYTGDCLRGARVRAVGTVGIYNGDTEIEFFEAEQVEVLAQTTGIEPLPLPLSTYDASLEISEGWLVQITGRVVAWIDSSAIVVDDGSGPVRAFLDGYNGSFAGVGGLDRVTVVGLVSGDGDGRRIRVRNYGAHPALPDDVTILARAAHLHLPILMGHPLP